MLLFSLACLAVPWMLLGKPMLLRRRHQWTSGYKSMHGDADGSSRRLMDDDATSDVSDRNGKYHADEFDFAEVMINQVRSRRAITLVFTWPWLE